MILLAVIIAWLGDVFPSIDLTTGQWLLVCMVALGLERDW